MARDRLTLLIPTPSITTSTPPGATARNAATQSVRSSRDRALRFDRRMLRSSAEAVRDETFVASDIEQHRSDAPGRAEDRDARTIRRETALHQLQRRHAVEHERGRRLRARAFPARERDLPPERWRATHTRRRPSRRRRRYRRKNRRRRCRRHRCVPRRRIPESRVACSRGRDLDVRARRQTRRRTPRSQCVPRRHPASATRTFRAATSRGHPHARQRCDAPAEARD